MRNAKKFLVLLMVVSLVLAFAATATAKKGGIPGPPSGSDLDVTMTTSGFAVANSAGDEVPFDIVITNNGDDTLVIDSVTFEGADVLDPPGVLNAAGDEGDSWTTIHYYVVDGEELGQFPLLEPTEVSKTVTVEAGDLTESATAEMKVYRIGACDWTYVEGTLTLPAGTGLCSDEFAGAEYWRFVSTPTKKRGKSPIATVMPRDGVPGNWCIEGEAVDGVQITYFPADGTCLLGGAGGEEIPTRNDHLFYLGGRDSAVVAEPCPNGVNWDALTCLP